ncbi:MAG: hypothetical protein KAT68_10600 [Bacteroidales bacterium]|nr:hypothetical protein [Bacteroidales bacterium]
MKNKTVLKSVTLFTIVLFFICATSKVNAQIPVETPSAKVMAKRFLKYGKVEVLESNMEKTEGASDEYGGIKITGTAKYTPAKIGKKPFKDLSYTVRFDLFDDVEKKVMYVDGIPDCGENGQAENVKYNEPFPFVFEYTMIPLDKYKEITSQKLNLWYILQ